MATAQNTRETLKVDEIKTILVGLQMLQTSHERKAAMKGTDDETKRFFLDKAAHVAGLYSKLATKPLFLD